jgi:molybdate transport system ATP-binding protein
MGARDVGSVLAARVVAHHDDGLSELATAAGALFLPRVAAAPGSTIRVRIAAHDVILSRARPEGLSALNILAGTVSEVRSGDGPGAMVALETGAGRVLARITRRSVGALGLEPGVVAHAVVKSVSVARGDVG